jgi:hypothetical protein
MTKTEGVMSSEYIMRHAWRNKKAGQPAILAEMLDDSSFLVDTLSQQVVEDPDLLKNLMGQFVWQAGLLQVVRPNSPEIRKALHGAAMCAKSICGVVSPGKGTVTISLGEGQTFEAPRLQNTFFNVHDFITAFYIAMAVQEKPVLDTLAKVDINTLHMLSFRPEEYVFHWARTLQGFHLGGAPWLEQEFLAAFKGTDPGVLKYGAVGYALNIAFPAMELFIATDEGAGRFNQVLGKALEAHKFFYGKDEQNPGEDQSNDPRGYIALGPLAFAATMAARGWPITVQSDYLPRCLIDGAR